MITGPAKEVAQLLSRATSRLENPMRARCNEAALVAFGKMVAKHACPVGGYYPAPPSREKNVHTQMNVWHATAWYSYI